MSKALILLGLFFGILVAIFLGTGQIDSDRSSSSLSPDNGFVLPETVSDGASEEYRSQRAKNSVDEYPLLVARYGQPDAILSTENDSGRPILPARIVLYRAAHLKVMLIPIGPVRGPVKGWTIFGYIDSSNNVSISAKAASTLLGRIENKRTSPPEVATGDTLQ